jgi:serine/threonine protein kinase
VAGHDPSPDLDADVITDGQPVVAGRAGAEPGPDPGLAGPSYSATGTFSAQGTGTFRRPFNPEVFGKYYLLDKVATGGMAEVFRAKHFGHSGFEKVLVIKRILAHWAEDPEFVEMFIDEAKLSVQLNHPNIAQIYDFGKIETHYFIAMEAVEGRDLKTLMRRLAERGERMPVELACYILHAVAKGLDYAHKKSDGMGLPLNIVHRDVSPSNVLVDWDGHIKLVDFGIAKAESATRESQSGVLKGKFQYMSPEQARGESLDHRSDLFSAGICLWEMLTGHRLFKRANDVETLEAIKACEVPLPSRYNPAVPPSLDRICVRALSLDPSARYPDGFELQSELEDVLLPNSPDRLQVAASTWIKERFGEEIRQDRERLDRGTQLAAQLHYGGDADLDIEPEAEEATPAPPVLPPTASTETVHPVPRPRGVNPMVAVGVAIVVSLVAVLGVLAWPLLFPTAPKFASLRVDVLPEGIEGVTLTLDGEAIPPEFGAVVPGVPHKLAVSAPGYGTRTRDLELVAGQALALEMQLSAEAIEPLETEDAAAGAAASGRGGSGAAERGARRPPSAPSAGTAGAPGGETLPSAEELLPDLDSGAGVMGASTVFFRSDPPGARLFVEGRKVGVTPFEWGAAEPGRTYSVEFRADGRQSVQAVVTGPQEGGSVVLTRELPARRDAGAEGDLRAGTAAGGAAASPGANASSAAKPVAPAAAAGAGESLGRLSVQMTPGWAKVYLNGAYVSTTPLFEHALPAGTYELRLLNERQGVDRTDSVTVRAGEVTRKAYQAGGE